MLWRIALGCSRRDMKFIQQFHIDKTKDAEKEIIPFPAPWSLMPSLRPYLRTASI